MKKSLFIFLRVIFVLFVLVGLAAGGLYFYYQHQSTRGIQESLNLMDAPVIGDRNRPMTIVEFFDYRCSHCSTMSHLVDEAIANDQDIKLVLRPVVLGDPESFKIATLVLTADMQRPGATEALHRQIMNLADIPSYEQVKAMASALGIDVAAAESGKNAEISRAIISQNTQLVRDIGFYGVPALVIGDKGFMPQGVMPGVNELRLMILDAKSRVEKSK